MYLINKSIDESKSKCMVCRKDLNLNEMIDIRSLLCHNCYDIISTIKVDDMEYDFYKERIKTGLLNKYKLIIWGKKWNKVNL